MANVPEIQESIEDRATRVWYEVSLEIENDGGAEAVPQRVRTFTEAMLQAWMEFYARPTPESLQTLSDRLDEAEASLGLLRLAKGPAAFAQSEAFAAPPAPQLRKRGLSQSQPSGASTG